MRRMVSLTGGGINAEDLVRVQPRVAAGDNYNAISGDPCGGCDLQ